MRRMCVLTLLLVLCACVVISQAQPQSAPQIQPRRGSATGQPRVLSGQALEQLRLEDVRDTDTLLFQGRRMSGAELKALARQNHDRAVRQAFEGILRGMGEPIPSRMAPARSSGGSSSRRTIVGRRARETAQPLAPCMGLAIRSIEPRKVIAGSHITIRGCGFQSQPGEVLLSTGPEHFARGSDAMVHRVPEQKLGMAVMSWSDTVIQARMRAPEESQGDAVRYLIAKTAAGRESARSDSIVTSSLSDIQTRIASKELIPGHAATPASFDLGKGDTANGWFVDHVEFGCDYLTPRPNLTCFIPNNASCWDWHPCNWPAAGATLKSAPGYADTHVGDVLVDWKTLKGNDAVLAVVKLLLRGPKGTESELPASLGSLFPW